MLVLTPDYVVATESQGKPWCQYVYLSFSYLDWCFIRVVSQTYIDGYSGTC